MKQNSFIKTNSMLLKTTLYVLISSVSCTLYSQSILSDVGMNNRTQSEKVYKIIPATDGLNRNNTSFNKNWILSMFDYAVGNLGYYNNNAISTSLKNGGLADEHAIGTTYFDGPWEWGYSFYNLPNGNATVLPSEFNNSILDRKEAYYNIFNWYKKVLNQRWPNKEWLSSVNGFYQLNHLGLKASKESNIQVDVVGSEVGENITGTSLQLAFTRGAARQYQIPWIVDLSSWFGGGNGTGVRDYSAFMANISQQMLKEDIEANRIGVLYANGRLEVKDGPINANFSHILDNVIDFDLEGSRIGALLENGSFYVKEPFSNSNWNLLAGNVNQFKLKGSRVGIKMNDSFIAVKTGALNSNYANFSGYVNFDISENRLALVKLNGDLVAQKNDLGNDLYPISGDVKDFKITDNVICYLKSDNSLHVIFGDFTNQSILLGANIKDFKVYGSRILYLKHDNTLWIYIPNSPYQNLKIGEDVYNFELDGNRIAKIQNMDKELYIHSGSNLGYINSKYTDEGWRFVSQNIQKVLFVNASNRFGMISSDPSRKFFAKEYPLDKNEPTEKTFWFEGGAAAGHSNSLTERIQMTSYMSGANIFHAEASNINYFLGSYKDSNNNYLSLSPLGKVGQSFYKFTNSTFPNRGIPYQPIAIVLPVDHGIGLETWKNNQSSWVHSYLHAAYGDQMTKSLFNTIWPSILNSQDPTEKKYLGNTKWGELFDVLTQDVSYEVLKEYPVVIVSGQWSPSSAETEVLRNYVNNGGNLVIGLNQRGSFTNEELGVSYIENEKNKYIYDIATINDDFLSKKSVSFENLWMDLNPLPTSKTVMKCNDLPAVISSVLGNGRIFSMAFSFTYNEALWDKIFEVLFKPEITPFSFNGSAQYLYTFEGEDIWNIMLINNDGIYKNASTSAFEVVDESKINQVIFTYQEKFRSIVDVQDITNNNEKVNVNNNTISASLHPGEIKILQVKTQKEQLSNGNTSDNFSFLEKNIKMYPNPSTNVVNITHPPGWNVTNWSIVTTSQLMLVKESVYGINNLKKQLTIELSPHSTSIYLVILSMENTFSGENVTITKKILKNH